MTLLHNTPGHDYERCSHIHMLYDRLYYQARRSGPSGVLPYIGRLKSSARFCQHHALRHISATLPDALKRCT